jgi:hypothetical protein
MDIYFEDDKVEIEVPVAMWVSESAQTDFALLPSTTRAWRLMNCTIYHRISTIAILVGAQAKN